MAHYYAPPEADKTNPLAWPYHASTDELKGLPPHILSMDELDPLRDEGMAFHRKLLAAGVKSTSRVNLGITHGSSLLFRQALPDVQEAALRDIVGFVKGL